MDRRSVRYAVIAPKWRAPGRPAPALNKRRLVRWDVVRETRPVVYPGDDLVVSGYEHMSTHWTWRAAQDAALRYTEELP